MHEISIFGIGGMMLMGEKRNIERGLFKCHFINHKSFVDWPWIERGSP
jgi:hypothetical protein